MKIYTVMMKRSRQDHGEPLSEWHEAINSSTGVLQPSYKSIDDAESVRSSLAKTNDYLQFVVVETILI